MLFALALLVPAALAAHKAALPNLRVPACPALGTVTYNRTVPDLDPFPKTQVDLCYTSSSLEITFTAYNETNFFYSPNYTTNGDIWNYEVMEAFLYKGTNDPTSYLELEVAPNNVTYNAWVYNPSKVRTDGAPFDHAFIVDPIGDGITASTVLDVPGKKWQSGLSVPLAFFNVDEGTARGTRWRMNFFRTVVAPDTFPSQLLGAWSPPDAPSFHKTPFFGNVVFV